MLEELPASSELVVSSTLFIILLLETFNKGQRSLQESPQMKWRLQR